MFNVLEELKRLEDLMGKNQLDIKKDYKRENVL